jgi:hypothetical protein
VKWRLTLAAVLVAVVALWWVILQKSPEYRQIPAQFRVEDFEAKEPTPNELEALKNSIESAARKRVQIQKPKVVLSDAGQVVPPTSYDAGKYESWVDQELLRRAETGESIPSDGSFDPSEALDRLKAGESRDDVLGNSEK